MDLGAGVDAILARALTLDRLAASIYQVTSDTDLHTRARCLARLIRQVRRVGATVAGLERHFVA